MDFVSPRMIAGSMSTVVLFLAYLYLWAVQRQRHLGLWAAGWGLNLVRHFLMAALPPTLALGPTPLLAAYAVTFSLSLVCISWGSHDIAQKPMPRTPLWLLGLGLAWYAASGSLGLPFLARTVLVYTATAWILGAGGLVLIRAGHLDKGSRNSAGAALLAATAVLFLAGPTLMDKPWFAQWGWLFTSAIWAWTGVSLLVVHFQSQHHELEKARQSQEDREKAYRQLASTMAEGLVVIDTSWRILFLNERFRRIMGLGPDRLDTGLDLRPALEGYGPARSVRAFLEAADPHNPNPAPVEIDSLVRPNGMEASLRLSPAGLDNSRYWLRGVALLVSDITGSRRAQKELARHRILLQSILGTMDEAAVSLEAETNRLLFHNRAAQTLLRLPESLDPDGCLDWRGIVHPDDRAAFGGTWSQLGAHGAAEWEHRILGRDNQVLTVRHRARLAGGHGETPRRIDSFLTDITRVRRAERQAAEKMWNFQALYENSMDPIVIIDARRMVVDANPAAQRFFGFSTDELPGVSTRRAHVTEESYRRFGELAHQRVAAMGYWHGEWPMMRAGDEITAELSMSALEWGPEGKPLKCMAIVRDTTERARLLRRQELDLAEKEVLLKEVHHRVKNNMQMIQSLLWMHAANPGLGQAAGVFEDLERRISAMGLVHETIYKAESLAFLDLEQYIRRLCEGLMRAFSGQTGGVGYVVRAEPVKLDLDKAMAVGLVLNELITNALKHAFGPEGGTITIRVRETAPGRVEIRLSDNGRGLSPADEARGDSLGLQLVRGLVQRQLGGGLRIGRGQGTEFVIDIPTAD